MKKYFLHDGTNQYGPFDLADLESKIITPQTLIWYESLPQWKPAAEIEELQGLLNNKVPAAKITSPPIVTTKEEDWSKKSYYYTDAHGQQGPFTLEQLKSRPIQPTTPVWYDPLPEWTTAEKVAGLKDILNHVQQTSAQVQPQVTARVYYYMDTAGKQQGPFPLEQLKGKPITAATLIWYDALPQWISAGSDASLKDIIMTAQQTAAPQQATSSAKSYYYMDRAGQQQGPFTFEQLKSKSITADTMIWYDSLPQWIKAGTDASLKDIIASATGGATDWSKKLFYYKDATGQQGPFTLEQLKGKPLTTATPVWYDPLPQWTTAGQVDVLKGFISPPGL